MMMRTSAKILATVFAVTLGTPIPTMALNQPETAGKAATSGSQKETEADQHDRLCREADIRLPRGYRLAECSDLLNEGAAPGHGIFTRR
jgi:hypothetical protein